MRGGRPRAPAVGVGLPTAPCSRTQQSLCVGLAGAGAAKPAVQAGRCCLANSQQLPAQRSRHARRLARLHTLAAAGRPPRGGAAVRGRRAVGRRRTPASLWTPVYRALLRAAGHGRSGGPYLGRTPGRCCTDKATGKGVPLPDQLVWEAPCTKYPGPGGGTYCYPAVKRLWLAITSEPISTLCSGPTGLRPTLPGGPLIDLQMGWDAPCYGQAQKGRRKLSRQHL